MSLWSVRRLTAAALVFLVVTCWAHTEEYDIFDDIDISEEDDLPAGNLASHSSHNTDTESVEKPSEHWPDWDGGGQSDINFASGTDLDRATALEVGQWYRDFTGVVAEKLRQYKRAQKDGDKVKAQVGVSGETTISASRDLARFIPADLDVFLHESSASQRVVRELFMGRTKYQKVRVYNSGDIYGNVLLLDDVIQSTQGDEFLYHEGLVHVAMSFHPNPKSVFLGGGGEGSTAREILRWNTVENLTMVDLDTELVELFRERFPQYGKGALDDPKTSLVYGDAKEWLKNSQDKFDVVILDFPDPNKFTYVLYTQDFYQMVKDRLNPGGIVVTQSGLCEEAGMEFAPVHTTMRSVFPQVHGFGSPAPLYSGMYCYNLAVADADFKLPTEADLKQRLHGMDLVFFDEHAPFRMLDLPASMVKQIEEDDQIITIQNPVLYAE